MTEHQCNWAQMGGGKFMRLSDDVREWYVEHICKGCGRRRIILYRATLIGRNDWSHDSRAFIYDANPTPVEVYSLRGDMDLAGSPAQDM